MTLEKQEEGEAYLQFERLDENQIAEEVQGIYAKTLVYQFEGRDGRLVTGLSIKGIYEVAKSLVRHGYDVGCEEAKIIEETEGEYKASCKATFVAPNGKKLETYGYSKTSKYYGKGNPNEFAWIQALSKAQRNAIRTLIPEKFAAKCIEEFLAQKDERLKTIKAPSTPTSKAPETSPTETKPIGIPTQRLTMLRFLKDIPQFVGINMKNYGPFKAEDVATVPELNAKSLVETGIATIVEVNPPRAPATGGLVAPPAEKRGLIRDLIANDGKKYGTIEMSEGEIKVVFDPPILDNPSIIGNFLLGRIVDNIVAKAKTENKFVEYQTDEDATGLKAIHIIGDVTEQNMEDLVNPCSWAAKTALSNRES